MFYVGWIPDKMIPLIWIHQTFATKINRVLEKIYDIISKLLLWSRVCLERAGNERISSHVNQSQRYSLTCYICHYCPFPTPLASQSLHPRDIFLLPAIIQRQQWLAISGDMEKPTVSDGTWFLSSADLLLRIVTLCFVIIH